DGFGMLTNHITRRRRLKKHVRFFQRRFELEAKLRTVLRRAAPAPFCQCLSIDVQRHFRQCRIGREHAGLNELKHASTKARSLPPQRKLVTIAPQFLPHCHAAPRSVFTARRMRSPSRFTPRSWGWQLLQHLGLLMLFIALALIAMGFISIRPTNVTAIW